VGDPRPVLVCLNIERDATLAVECGIALALSWGAPLNLAAIVIMPAHRPLDSLLPEEERTLNTLLDRAAALALSRGMASMGEIWVARAWNDAIADIAVEYSAGAVVIGWRTAGPLGLFDIGRPLRKLLACPIIMVEGEPPTARPASWPPRWLAETELRFAD
jgi:hypothetical protein